MQKNISLDLFQNTNSLNNNLFNFLYRKIIFKNDNNYECYLKNGYQKIGNIDDKYIKNIIRDLNAQSQNIPTTTTQTKLKKNKNTITDVKKIIDGPLKTHLKNLEKIFNASIKLSYFEIIKNYHINFEGEQYSNFLHTDGYIVLMQKIFINLGDINANQGPLHVMRYPLSKQTKKKIKENNYRLDDKNLIKGGNKFFINTGKKGDVLVVDSTRVLHKAGVPKKNNCRDTLHLEFVFVPSDKACSFYLDKNELDFYLNDDNIFSKNETKIKTKFELIKKFLKMIK